MRIQILILWLFLTLPTVFRTVSSCLFLSFPLFSPFLTPVLPPCSPGLPPPCPPSLKRVVGSFASNCELLLFAFNILFAAALTFTVEIRLIQTVLVIMDSFPCSWEKKALIFSLNSTHLIRTPR